MGNILVSMYIYVLYKSLAYGFVCMRENKRNWIHVLRTLCHKASCVPSWNAEQEFVYQQTSQSTNAPSSSNSCIVC